MATALNKQKHDIQINDIPYRIRGYQRGEFSTFIPRFGVGDQKESEFDLLRSKTFSFEGGNMQRQYIEDEMVYGADGAFQKYTDGVIYPATIFTENTSGGIGNSKGKLTAICSDDNTVCGTKVYGSTAYMVLMGADLQSSWTYSMGTVAGLTSIVFWQGYYFGWNGTTTVYRCTTTGTGTTFTDASKSISKVVNFNEILYGTDGYKLYRYSGTISASSWEEVAELPYLSPKTGSQYYEMLVYNNRVLILRADGMYAYDGIQLVTIESNRAEEKLGNYRYPATLRGYLYYHMNDGFYRFNGSLIEKLYDGVELGTPKDMRYYKGKLWILYGNSADLGSSRYDKAMGYDYSTGDIMGGRVMVFDGVSMLCYGRPITIDNSAYTNDYSGQNEVDRIYPYDDNQVAVYRADSQDFQHSMTEVGNTQAETDIVTSIFDGEFPQITKELEQIELVFDGTVTSDTFTLQYKKTGFDGSTSWTTIGTFDSTDAEKLVVDDIPAGLTWERIQIRAKGTITDDNYGIKQIIIRYTLQPEYKNQWTLTAMCYGDSDFAPLMLSDDTDETQAVDILRGNIYESRESNIPVVYLDIDYLVLDGAINDSVTTVTVDSTKILKSDTGYIQVGTEIMKYTAKTDTTLTVVRGVLGSVATSHSDNDIAHVAYRTVVRSIQNERVELSDEEMTYDTTRNRDSEITLVLQEV